MQRTLEAKVELGAQEAMAVQGALEARVNRPTWPWPCHLTRPQNPGLYSPPPPPNKNTWGNLQSCTLGLDHSQGRVWELEPILG